jgi:hypothetical protein
MEQMRGQSIHSQSSLISQTRGPLTFGGPVRAHRSHCLRVGPPGGLCTRLNGPEELHLPTMTTNTAGAHHDRPLFHASLHHCHHQRPTRPTPSERILGSNTTIAALYRRPPRPPTFLQLSAHQRCPPRPIPSSSAQPIIVKCQSTHL